MFTDSDLQRWLAEHAASAVSQLLGCKLVTVSRAAATCQAAFTATPALCNHRGLIHGGVVAAILDTVMSYAVLAGSELACAPATLEMKTVFLHPVNQGRLIADGHVVHMGRSIAFLEGTLQDEAGQVLATATATAKLIVTNRAPPDRRPGDVPSDAELRRGGVA